LIVPHAGYVYSGPIAGSAYAAWAPLRGKVERVVLLGPAHRVAFRGLAAPTVDFFDGPLGPVPIDRAAIEAVADLPQVVLADRPHAQEHALEVQIPFLQAVLGDFCIVPLVVGDARDDEVAEVLARLWGGDETRVVISSDSEPLPRLRDRAGARPPHRRCHRAPRWQRARA
jgi:AmmeMemoRadiSam system protein B